MRLLLRELDKLLLKLVPVLCFDGRACRALVSAGRGIEPGRGLLEHRCNVVRACLVAARCLDNTFQLLLDHDNFLPVVGAQAR